ncbi:MAG: phospho-N-acetylmuramoyl-pentapeptide-transferase [Gemmatimonadetes bacterium]|nr:phospho-N-acetylmuramoyl-pentapeptide-transferase [Gemmatimonadota bacterium]
MLYHLFPELVELHSGFNVIRYITFRSAAAGITALLITWIVGPAIIGTLRRKRWGQVIRQVGPHTHFGKQGTPTMGGLIMISAATVSTLLWAELTNPYVLIALASFLVCGALGFVDDYLKISRGNADGLVDKVKLFAPAGVGMAVGIFLIASPLSSHEPTVTALPFFSDLQFAFAPLFFVLFTSFVVAGSSNAVNLSDGLDGLAAGLVAIAATTFAFYAYLAGRVDTSAYLGLFHLPGAGELTVFVAALIGTCIGFLWFNSHPASVFMGDTGSLALGGALGVLAILVKTEFLLVIAGGVFVAEALSVIAQKSFFKFTRWRTGEPRRLLRMAPLHHHFEKLGWKESKVVVRFWVAGLLCAIGALAALKIR